MNAANPLEPLRGGYGRPLIAEISSEAHRFLKLNHLGRGVRDRVCHSGFYYLGQHCSVLLQRHVLLKQRRPRLTQATGTSDVLTCRRSCDGATLDHLMEPHTIT